MTPLSWLANFIQHRVCKTNLRINLDTTRFEAGIVSLILIVKIVLQVGDLRKPFAFHDKKGAEQETALAFPSLRVWRSCRAAA